MLALSLSNAVLDVGWVLTWPFVSTKRVLFLFLKAERLLARVDGLDKRSLEMTFVEDAIGRVTDGVFEASTVSVSTIMDFVFPGLEVILSVVLDLENNGLIRSFFLGRPEACLEFPALSVDTGVVVRELSAVVAGVRVEFGAV